jgi:5-methylthioadenosine/S-adenosylhomocysteine deaminase
MGSSGQASSSGPPARGEFVIRNGFVLTMDSALGDIPRGSVHVRNGEIVAVGADVNAPAAEVIDATDMIVLPGLIETHWHMWNTLFRSFAGDEQAHSYFLTVARYGTIMRSWIPARRRSSGTVRVRQKAPISHTARPSFCPFQSPR